MAISYKESMEKYIEENNVVKKAENIIAKPMTTMNIDDVSVASYPVMTLEEVPYDGLAYSGEETWTEDKTNYRWFNDYEDNNYSVIDDKKNITINEKQINITQEENSQFIPFEMPRKYDGYDLTKANISIHYDRGDGSHGSDQAVNVRYNSEKIRFAWKVGSDVSAFSGKLKFEIHATGVIFDNTGKEYAYEWKTKSSTNLEVIQSICDTDCEGAINIDDSWVQELVTDVAERVANQIADAQIGSQVTEAKNAANRAETAANNAESVATSVVESALSNYSTTTEMETYVGNEIAKADISDKLEKYALKSDIPVVPTSNLAFANDAGYLTEHQDISGKSDVGHKHKLSDIEDYEEPNLSGFALKSEVPSIEGLASEEFVQEEIAKIDVSDVVYTKEQTYNKEEIDEALKNVEVDLTGYATEKFVTDKTNILSGSIATNTSGISSLSGVVVKLQEDVNSIDTSPRLTYDISYNDTEDVNGGENKLVFYEIENEGKEGEVKTAKRIYTITGGSNSDSSSNNLYIDYDLDNNGNKISSYVFTIDNIKNKESVIKCTFHGEDHSGDSVSYANGTWQFRRGTSGAWTTVETKTLYPNVIIEFDVSKCISTAGTYQVRLEARDDTGAYTPKTWTIQLIDLKLESDFNDKLAYPIGIVPFDYTPHGAISKDIHFVLDGVEIDKITTTSSGIQTGYDLPPQEHGSHLLEVYMTAEINGNTIGLEEIIDEESGEIIGYNHTIKKLKDILWYDSTSSIPVIGSVYQEFTARQYDTTNIEYTVYDPTTEAPTVEIAVDGKVVSTPTLEKATNIYPFRTDAVGEHIITITCGETVKTLKANITKIDINVSPVTSGLVFDFNPSGKSNNDVDRVWSNDTVSMSVSDNFDWINGGYQYDENGDQYFCIKSGTSAMIDYKLFADEAKRNGKEMKLIFKTTNVAKPDTTFLHCVDNTTDSDHIGIQMGVHEAVIYGKAGKLELPYSEDDIIEFEFNISKNTEAIPMVMGYEDGVSTRPMVYDDSYNFTQNTPKFISLGSDDCDLHIYRFKVYNTSLTDRGILNNFIADARNAEEMITRYERNQIYDENQNLDPDVLAEKCPWLRIIKLDVPYFTNHKDNRVGNTTVEYIYKNGIRPSDNWKATDVVHSGQGTSSNNYGAAGRNLDIMVKRTKDKETGLYLNENPIFNLSDGTQTNKVSLTENSVPVNYFNIKVNIASSNNLTNAMLAKKYNEFNPYNRPFIREDENEISKIKDTMEFYNCVVFVREFDQDLTTHREFSDNEWHFYAIGNIGDSKKTDDTRLTDVDDKYECCVEIMDVEKPLSDFPVNTMMNAMAYEEDDVTKEKIYTWAKNENLGILHELIDGEYVLTQDTEVDLSKTYYVDILEHDDFSEDYTYGWRYIWEDGETDEENEEVFDYCKQKWIELYRFITTSTDEEFKAHLGDYFVIDSALYNYLFTTRYCMVDNRAKNTFWHYGKTGEVDAEGNPVRKWDLNWGYDMDTSLGLNNYGKQVYRYGLEDTDVDEKGEEVFREMDSTFFCRIRDLFKNELKSMYNLLNTAWNAESFIVQCDEWQSQFPEELWRIDIDRKYIRTFNSSFINGKGNEDFLKTMSNGKMKYHRRQWERSQEQYMASKYQSTVASGDDNSIVMRCSVSVSDDAVVKPNYTLKLTPYAYMYLNVESSSGVVQIPAEPNVEYEIPFNGEKTDILKVYSASCIQSLGDLSSCYLATINTAPATKLKELIIGNSTEGYDNPYFNSLTTGSNYLLEKINIENVSGLNQSLNLSALNNLKELYASGSNASGVTFADGGKIEIAELPAINTLIMKNLIYLTTLDIVDFSKLTDLTVENCNTVDLLTILDNAPNINRVRLTGVDWTLKNGLVEDGEDKEIPLLNRLYNMYGKDKDGFNVDKSVLSGKVHVPIIRQQKLREYKEAWSDLYITYNTEILQYPVMFVNDDGSPLLDKNGNPYVQYVDEGEYAIDPIANNLIDIPEKDKSISTVYTFKGWDIDFTKLPIFEPQTITATYSETIRQYGIQYMSMGKPVKGYETPVIGNYGDNISCNGVIPTYTDEEGAYKYYLFNRWDKSGLLDGGFNDNDVKIVNAVFDEFKYTSTAFNGKELADLSPVQIYAMNKLNLAESIITDKDPYSFIIGNDVNYDDIESELLISEKTYFDGAKYIDTGIQLFNEDKDFVLAIDYEFLDGCKTNAVLAQCFQANGSNGFKLWHGSSSGFSGARLTWGTVSDNVVELDKREIIVIRHKKGDNNLTIYKSNLDGDNVITTELTRNKSTIGTGTLVFGSARADDGIYENHAIGNINWAKVWYKDLGDDVCQSLAMWTHESITLEACGFRKYYLTDNTNKRCSFSLLASHLLGRTKKWNTNNTNDGGWAKSELNKSLNTRLYNAMPTQIKSLLKQVIVYSNDGIENKSVTPVEYYTEVTPSNCYITIPAIIEVDPTMTSEPYNNEGSSISYLSTDDSRKRAFDGGDFNSYWLRSPSASFSNYVWRVDFDGDAEEITQASNNLGVLIEISF